ncbi:hypothetical protein FRC07_005630, partial [Ceratobasidium sp. 392]
MSNVPPLTLGQARRNIKIRHLDQLSKLQLSRAPPNQEPAFESPYLALLEKWSDKNEGTIANAVQNRVYGGPNGSPVNWNYAFLAFMESMAVYLRDWSLVVDAVELYRQGHIEEALQKLEDSIANIKKLSDKWHMDFVVLCDLTNKSSTDHPLWNGPYCGAFYSRDAKAPFIGVGFKGTDPLNVKDWLVDLNYKTQQVPVGILYNTHVSGGAYNGLFGDFSGQQAFALINKGLDDILAVLPNTTGKNVITHCTGHSLGGNYSSLCFTQFTEPNALPSKAALGDMYTFGAPRSGLQDFAQAAKDHLGSNTGSSWRIANKGDGVPQVPPVFAGDEA